MKNDKNDEIVLTLGIGKNISGEQRLKKSLQDIGFNAKFYGADPMYLQNAKLFSEIGSYFPLAVGASTGLSIARVLNEKGRYQKSEVYHIELIDYLNDYLKIKHIDHFWMDNEYPEYDIFPYFYKGGKFEKAGISVCQLNMEVHYPNEEQKRKFQIFVKKIIEDRQWAILRTKMGFSKMLLLLLSMSLAVAFSLFQDQQRSIRIMTWNAWRGGGNVTDGVRKLAKHIQIVNPDVVTLQEMYIDPAETVKTLLGPEWSLFRHTINYGYAILTRHKIVPNSEILRDHGIGCTILLNNGYEINVWGAHLHYLNYGPDVANDRSVTDVEQILNAERTRLAQMQKVLEIPEVQTWLSQSNEIPIFICGDFNTPSHFDWIEETREQHNNWVVEWPVTKLLQSNGFIDSYRHLYPNVTQYPGLSWSTVEKIREDKTEEPQDRIDFIFFRGPLVARQSTMYSGNEILTPTPYHMNNDFPSDHAAFFTDFDFV